MLVNFSLRHQSKCGIKHPVCSAVAVVLGVFNQVAVVVEKAEANAPAIDADAGDTGRFFDSFTDTGFDFRYKVGEVPA